MSMNSSMKTDEFPFPPQAWYAAPERQAAARPCSFLCPVTSAALCTNPARRGGLVGRGLGLVVRQVVQHTTELRLLVPAS